MKTTLTYILTGFMAILSVAVIGCDPGTSSDGGRFTISGTISVPGNTAIDSDVNEINVEPVANDTFATAQVLKKNPVILGGYANTPKTGEPGNSYDDGDVNDFFKIALTKNETVTLYIAEYETANLNLYLFDNDREEVESSTGKEDIE